MLFTRIVLPNSVHSFGHETKVPHQAQSQTNMWGNLTNILHCNSVETSSHAQSCSGPLTSTRRASLSPSIMNAGVILLLQPNHHAKGKYLSHEKSDAYVKTKWATNKTITCFSKINEIWEMIIWRELVRSERSGWTWFRNRVSSLKWQLPTWLEYGNHRSIIWGWKGHRTQLKTCYCHLERSASQLFVETSETRMCQNYSGI